MYKANIILHKLHALCLLCTTSIQSKQYIYALCKTSPICKKRAIYIHPHHVSNYYPLSQTKHCQTNCRIRTLGQLILDREMGASKGGILDRDRDSEQHIQQVGFGNCGCLVRGVTKKNSTNGKKSIQF